MGYPFDRPASAQEVTQSNMFLADFTAPVTNMLSTEVIISHVNKTTLRGNGAPETMRKIFVAPWILYKYNLKQSNIWQQEYAIEL